MRACAPLAVLHCNNSKPGEGYRKFAVCERSYGFDSIRKLGYTIAGGLHGQHTEGSFHRSGLRFLPDKALRSRRFFWPRRSRPAPFRQIDEYQHRYRTLCRLHPTRFQPAHRHGFFPLLAGFLYLLHGRRRPGLRQPRREHDIDRGEGAGPLRHLPQQNARRGDRGARGTMRPRVDLAGRRRRRPGGEGSLRPDGVLSRPLRVEVRG